MMKFKKSIAFLITLAMFMTFALPVFAEVIPEATAKSSGYVFTDTKGVPLEYIDNYFPVSVGNPIKVQITKDGEKIADLGDLSKTISSDEKKITISADGVNKNTFVINVVRGINALLDNKSSIVFKDDLPGDDPYLNCILLPETGKRAGLWAVTSRASNDPEVDAFYASNRELAKADSSYGFSDARPTDFVVTDYDGPINKKITADMVTIEKEGYLKFAADPKNRDGYFQLVPLKNTGFLESVKIAVTGIGDGTYDENYKSRGGIGVKFTPNFYRYEDGGYYGPIGGIGLDATLDYRSNINGEPVVPLTVGEGGNITVTGGINVVSFPETDTDGIKAHSRLRLTTNGKEGTITYVDAGNPDDTKTLDIIPSGGPGPEDPVYQFMQAGNPATDIVGNKITISDGKPLHIQLKKDGKPLQNITSSTGIALVSSDTSVITAVREENKTILLTPVGNGTANIVANAILGDYDNVAGAILQVTVSDFAEPEVTEGFYLSADQQTKVKEYTLTQQAPTEFLIRKANGEWADPLQKNFEFSAADFEVIAPSIKDSAGGYKGVKISPKSNEGGVVKYSDGDIDVSITFKPSNIDPWFGLLTPDMDGGLDYITDSQDHIDDSEFVLVKDAFGKKENVSPTSAFKVVSSTTTIGNTAKTPSITYDYTNSKHMLHIDRNHQGVVGDPNQISIIKLSTTVSGQSREFTVTVEIEAPIAETIITVKTFTIDAINAAIANATVENGANIVILLKDGEYVAGKDSTVNLNKRVMLRGTSRTGSIIKGNVLTTKAANGGHIENLTLDGTNKTSTGVTGPQGNDYDVHLFTCDIKNFAIGFDNRDIAYSFGDLDFIDNNVGVMLKSTGNRQSTGVVNFTNNEIGIEIVEGTNKHQYAFALFLSNFKGNDINVKNADANPAYIFAKNYFDDRSKSKFTGKNPVIYSPYFAEEITDPNNDWKKPLTVDMPDDGVLPIENGATAQINTSNFAGKDVKLKMDNVDDTGAPTKVAEWSFGTDTVDSKVIMNPNIDTTIAPFTGTVAKYQPVSFKHSGALPGVATINLVKDNANAPTENLKLYKIVGGKLVLQPEVPTFANNEYTFARGDCSDYIITDATVTYPKDDNTTPAPPSYSGGGYGGGGSVISSGDVANAISNAPNGTATIDITSTPIVSSESFSELAKSPNTTLVLNGDGYSWSFSGRDISPYAQAIAFNTQISKYSPNMAQLTKAAGNVAFEPVYFSFHGELPGKATVRVQTGFKNETVKVYSNLV